MLINKKISFRKNFWRLMASYTGGDRMMMAMTLALILAAFFVGYYAGQVKILREGIGGGSVKAAVNTQNNLANAASPAPAAQQQAPDQPLSDQSWKELLNNPGAVKGSNKAKITMVEFTDFQCPFCKRHYEQTSKQIDDNFIKTGKVRLIQKMLPLPFHPNAHVAAEAARCAGDQNKYWEMHDQLFAKQEEWSNLDNKTPAVKQKFDEYAKGIGINVANFDKCYESGKYKKAIDDDAALASKVGANGTPTFYINGKSLVGALPYSSFESVFNGN
jgi:protein-disulfide isomerase